MKKKIINRVGETNMSTNGMLMTIIAYRRNNDIDVMFSDGTVVTNKSYCHFKEGRITTNSIMPNKRVGEVKMMNCGMKCEIIAYHNSHNLTVRFEDGEILTKKYYVDFKRGMIKHPKTKMYQYAEHCTSAKKKHIGEKHISTSGLEMKIIGWNNSLNIDVQFENGNVVHSNYSNFINGKICPEKRKVRKHNKNNRYAKIRIGETRMMKCGLKCEIIKYENNHNISVCFEDGVICERRDYRSFVQGKIVHPNYISEKHLNEEKKMKCGLMAKIVRYGNYNDIDILFEDGTKMKNKSYASFKTGDVSLGCAKYKKVRIGESRKAKNGQISTIIDYNNCRDITIIYDDGTIVPNRTYQDFCEGSIENPNNKSSLKTSFNEFTMLYYLSKLGFQKAEKGSLKNLGLKGFELDAFHQKNMIGIEYDGYMHSKKESFKRDIEKDKLCHRNHIKLIRIRENLTKTSDFVKTFYLNTSAHFSIEYQDTLQNLCDYLTTYGFKKINVDFSKDKKKIITEYERNFRNYHIGEKYINKFGDTATIVRYLSNNDLVVQFNDGTLQHYNCYSKVKKGNFVNMTRKKMELAKKKCEERRIMNCGMECMIVDYKNSEDITVQFTDGKIINHRSYYDFKKGAIFNPNLRKKTI